MTENWTGRVAKHEPSLSNATLPVYLKGLWFKTCGGYNHNMPRKEEPATNLLPQEAGPHTHRGSERIASFQMAPGDSTLV